MGNKAVLKYPLTHERTLLPQGAKVIHVAPQKDVLCAWAIVDPVEERMTVPIYILGTGRPSKILDTPGISHHSTHMISDDAGVLVLHVFMAEY